MKIENSRALVILSSLLMVGLLGILVLNAMVFPALAQSGDEAWTDPVNLSQSGGAIIPQILVDSKNRVHVLWRDEFEGLKYSQRTKEGWSAPRQVAFPFPETLHYLKLRPGPEGLIHAIWWDETTGSLSYSRVQEDNFSQPSQWTAPAQLVDATVGQFNYAIDSAGGLHLIYAKVEDDTSGVAGIYYRYASAPGYAFNGDARLIFDSLYFRGLTPQDMLLDISTGVDGAVYAGWDLELREQVYFVRSLDNGDSWEAVSIVDSRLEEDGFDAVGPRWMQIQAQDDWVMRLWQAGHGQGICSQYYQFSADGGESWSDQALVTDSLQGCASRIHLLIGPNKELLVMSERAIGIFLQAWDGSTWSTPQLQTPLTNFTNPDTFRQVEMDCRRAAIDLGNNLYVVGCDNGNGKDIWILSRPIGELETWFPTPTPTVPWSNPNRLLAEKAAISNPILISDLAGKLHAFWNEQGENAIYYSRWEGDVGGSGIAWSNVSIVVNAPSEKAEQPDALVDGSGQLMLVWSSGAGGPIGFSSVESTASIFPDEWSTPVHLPAPRVGPTSPQILTDPNGTLFVVYAIPVNEQRGIYLTRSDDRGTTWSQPFSIFDAGTANWDMVERPSIAIDSDGHLHAMWSKFMLNAGSVLASSELYYASSSDGGLTWSAPSLVSARPAVSSQIVHLGNNVLQRVWTDENENQLTLWYQVSFDGGAHWDDANRISEYGNQTDLFSVQLDAAGVGHLLQIRRGIFTEAGFSPYVLQHLVWDGTNWGLIESLQLGDLEVSGLASAGGTLGNLGVLYIQQNSHEEGAQQLANLLFVNRPVDLDVVVATPLPTFTPQPDAVQQASPTPLPSPTPTIAFSRDSSNSRLLGGLGAYGGLLIGVIPAALIVVLVFSFGKRRRR